MTKATLSRLACWAGRALRFCRGAPFMAAALAAGILAMSCSEGAYPVDIFYEMHYQPSFASNEPPRLSPPEGAVPWFPTPASTRTGEELFAVNCSMCHGLEGKGDGPVLRIMESKYGYTPALTPDLTDPIFVQSQSVEALKDIIRLGLVVMPPWEKLLTKEEIQLLAEYILTLDGE